MIGFLAVSKRLSYETLLQDAKEKLVVMQSKYFRWSFIMKCIPMSVLTQPGWRDTTVKPSSFKSLASTALSAASSSLSREPQAAKWEYAWQQGAMLHDGTLYLINSSAVQTKKCQMTVCMSSRRVSCNWHSL